MEFAIICVMLFDDGTYRVQLIKRKVLIVTTPTKYPVSQHYSSRQQSQQPTLGFRTKQVVQEAIYPITCTLVLNLIVSLCCRDPIASSF